MILTQRVVRPIEGVSKETFAWPEVTVADKDIQQARECLAKISYEHGFLAESRTTSDYRLRDLAGSFATKRIMALSGVQNRAVIFESPRSWITKMKENAWHIARVAGFTPATQDELQVAINKLAGTPDAEGLFARFTNNVALHADGAAYPCLASDTVGTIEHGVDGKVRLTEVAFGAGNSAPLLVESSGLTVSPLSAHFKLGLSCAPLGSRLLSQN